MKKHLLENAARQSGLTAYLHFALGVALFSSLLSFAVAQAQIASGSDSKPVQVEIQGRAIPKGPHCIYMRLDELPVDMRGGLATVNGTVNGSSTPMLVDTGAKHTELSLQEAEKLGLNLGHTTLTEIDATGKEEAVYETNVGDVALGKNRWGRSQLEVTQILREADGAIAGADIVLGGYRRDIEFSLSSSEIKFFVPSGCENAFLAYWDDNASTAPIAAWSGNDPRLLVTVEVNGHQMTALIDSGSPNSVLTLEAAARAGITPQSAGVTEINGGEGTKYHGKAWLASFNSFTIGGETIKRPQFAIADLWGSVPAASQSDLQSGLRLMSIAGKGGAGGSNPGKDAVQPKRAEAIDADRPDMLLGVDFLRAHRVLLAISQQKMYFSYVGGRVFGGTGAAASTAPQS